MRRAALWSSQEIHKGSKSFRTITCFAGLLRSPLYSGAENARKSAWSPIVTNRKTDRRTHATKRRRAKSNDPMKRVAVFVLICALAATGHAIALCAQDCAEGAGGAANHIGASSGSVGEGSCHASADMPFRRGQRRPEQSPRAPQRQNCGGHALSVLIAAPVARALQLVPAMNFSAAIPAEHVSDSFLSSESVFRASALTFLAGLDFSPQLIFLRI